VLIAAFMVAIFLGPRRWMAWAAQLRDRVRLIRAALRARREPPRDTDEALRDTDEAPRDTDEAPLRD
jgi:hypothetical protein